MWPPEPFHQLHLEAILMLKVKKGCPVRLSMHLHQRVKLAEQNQRAPQEDDSWARETDDSYKLNVRVIRVITSPLGRTLKLCQGTY